MWAVYANINLNGLPYICVARYGPTQAADVMRILAWIDCDLPEHRRVNAGLILGLRPANKRQGYFVMMSLIGWMQA